jgi:hypothetical protein
MQARIFKPRPCNQSQLCHSIRDQDFERVAVTINGDRRACSWRPIAMQLITNGDGRSLIYADSPWIGSHALILRPSAIQVMKPLLLRHGEILPLMCEGAEM